MTICGRVVPSAGCITAGIRFRFSDPTSNIREATRNTLERADELGCESLVLPALGCGVAGFDLEDGAWIIAEEIAASDPETLSDVRLIAYNDEEAETVRKAAEVIRSAE